MGGDKKDKDKKNPYEVMRDGNIQTRKKVLEALKEAVSLSCLEIVVVFIC